MTIGANQFAHMQVVVKYDFKESSFKNHYGILYILSLAHPIGKGRN